jgi:hypothetical protein
MSMGLLVGFIIAYPMNWGLVANHLKHGMMTVRPTAQQAGMADHGAHAGVHSRNCWPIALTYQPQRRTSAR